MDTYESLGFLLNRASHALAKALRIVLEKYAIDLPHSQFVLLRLLYCEDGLSQQEIAALLCKDAAAIKRTIDNLTKKGLAERVQVSKAKNSIHITGKGRLLMCELLKHVDEILIPLLDGIDTGEYKTTIRSLRRIYENSRTIEQGEKQK